MTASGDISRAVGEWRRCLGTGRVVTDAEALARYGANVSGLRREIAAVLYPSATAEVKRVVEIANEHLAPLYPVSRGRNWGLGSRLPVRDGAAVVDLSRMKRIHEINVPHHYAVVEPGVTQGALYDRLRQDGLPLILNVTGSSLDSSLIGNALERGVGYFSGRAESLAGLEVVLGNGEVIQTGAGHFPGSATTYINRYGVGPFIDGLFSQSNFGIVTRAGVELIPERDEHAAVVCSIDRAEDLGVLVDALADLRKRDLVQTAVHIANRERTMISLCPLLFAAMVRELGLAEGPARELAPQWLAREGFGAWSAIGGLMGTSAQIREACRAVRRAVRGIGRVVVLNDLKVAVAARLGRAMSRVGWVRRKRALLAAIEPLYGLAKGVPTDAALGSVCWPATGEVPAAGADPDVGTAGLLYCLPMVPMSGASALETVAITASVFEQHGFTSYITMNMVGTRALECVINLAFRRDQPERVDRAHACIRELHKAFLKRGLIPYRVGIDAMDLIVSEGDPYWQTVRRLKDALDPNHIISPGRYSLI